MKKRQILISVLILSQLFGCKTVPDKQKNSTIANQNKNLRQKLTLLKGKSSKNEFNAQKLLDEVKLAVFRNSREMAKDWLDLLFLKFPASPEAAVGKELLLELNSVNKKKLDSNCELAYDFSRKKIIKNNQNYLGLMLGAGGEAESISFELARLLKNYMVGLGATWMRTNDVKKTYYVSGTSSPLNSDLGYNNNGDEIEIYGL